LKYEEVVRYVNEILSEYEINLTLRQIFYRLVASYNYPNTKSAYSQLSKQLVKARERRDVDPSRIVDRSREFLGGEFWSFDHPSDFLHYKTATFLSSPKRYTRKMWTYQPEFVLVWIEKDALSRVVFTVADKYKVITAPSRGYGSYTYLNEAISYLPEDKEITILHFADHDPSGVDMTRDLEKRLKRYCKLEGLNLNLNVQRIALNYDQVEKYNLIPNPTKRADPRSKNYVSQFGNQCWELDAIEPNDLQKIVEETIRSHIDFSIWKETLEQQEKERRELEKMFSEIERLLIDNGFW